MQKKYLQWSLYLAGLLVLLIASVVLSLSVGEMNLGFMDIFSILGKGHESMEYTILSQIRFPRVLLGIAVGGALSLSGILLQGVYRNPLVEPYTLGNFRREHHWALHLPLSSDCINSLGRLCCRLPVLPDRS